MGTQMMKKCALLLLGTLLCTTIHGQSKDTLFKPVYETTKVKSPRSTFTHSDSIALDGLGTIYALAIDAIVTQPRESSFVRVVLEDKEGHQYLVAECDRFRYDQDQVRLEQFCQETAALKGIVPVCLRCYIAGGANLTVTNIRVSNGKTTKGVTFTVKTASSIKAAQEKDIADRINEYNVRHDKLWYAGVTKRSLCNYSDRTEFRGEQNAYWSNLQYYAGGIYDIGEMDDVPARDNANNSPYVPDFDWRNRHGKNWISPVKDQGFSGYCVAFAINGMLESRTNLYFNNKLDLKLSEQDIVYNYARAHYKDLDKIYSTGMNSSDALGLVVNHGVLDSLSVPFIDDTLYVIPSRPFGNECIQISNRYYYHVSSTIDADSIKRILIHHGPVVSGFRAVVESGKTQWHATTLVGYHTINAGDTIHKVANPEDGGLFPQYVVPDEHPYIGQTYWVMKDSYGVDEPDREGGGYLYLLFMSYENMSSLNYTTSPIISRNYTADDIVVEDADGDGYFNWGIGPRPNDRLPAWAEQEEDGDDNDWKKGAMDEYGFLADLSYTQPVFVVDHDMTDAELADSLGSRFLRRSIRINSGVTLTIQGDICFYKNKKIYMNANSILKIDGGTLVDATLYKSGNNASVKIVNGGKIQSNKKPEFILPPGISLDMDEGEIQ